MLYLVPTPIGNLADITLRAIEVLREADTILCEDTRSSSVLLRHHSIATPTKAYHKFNEKKELSRLLDWLRSGKKIALITDAGMPALQDPGESLIKKCREEGLPVTPLPGPNAALTALIGSGLPTSPFQFIGYLPKKEKERKTTCLQALYYPGTTICYESPHRIQTTLKLLQQVCPERLLVLARELTKKFETFHRGTAVQLLDSPYKGELCLLLSPPEQATSLLWREHSPDELVTHFVQTFSLSTNEAIKLAATLCHMPKKTLYKRFSQNRVK